MTFGAKGENCNKGAILQSVTNMLKNSSEITEIGLMKYLLRVNFEKLNNSLNIHQKAYIERLELKRKDLPKSSIDLSLSH